MIRGWAICTYGWTGTMTCGSDVATATAYGSAISQAILLRDQGLVTLRMRASGAYRISRGSSFALAVSGNMATRLGFSAAGGATSHTASGIGYAATIHDGALYDPGSAVQPGRGVNLTSHAVRRSRGIYEWRQPQVAATMTLTEWLAAMESWNTHLTTPAEIDIIEESDDGELTAHRVQASSMSLRSRDDATWIGYLSIECTEAP